MISLSFGILECSIPLDCASLARCIALVKFGSTSKSSLTPTPFFACARSQNFKKGVIPCASKIFSA